MNIGNKIVHQSYTWLPMPDSLIKKLEKLVDRDRAENGISFENKYKESLNKENGHYNND